MLLYGIFYALRFDANVPLCGGGAAMLQQSLNQDNIIAIGLVDLCGIPFSEAVGADILIAQIIADDPKLLLDRALRDWKDDVRSSDTVAQAVVLDVLVEHQRDGENPALAGFLLHDLQPVTVAIPDDIAQSEFQNVADPKPQVALQNQRRSDAIIGSAARETFPHGLNDLFVLLCGQCFCFLIHSLLP